MRWKHVIGPAAIATTLGLSTTAIADPLGARALSYAAFDEIIVFPFVGEPLIPQPGETTQTGSAAQLENVPGTPGLGNAQDVGSTCVGQVGAVPANALSPPCPAANFFNQVPLLPGYNKFARSDALAIELGNPRGPSANVISEIQLNTAGDCPLGNSCQGGPSNASTSGPFQVSQPSPLVLQFFYDYCREGVLDTGVATGSLARATGAARFIIQELVPGGNNIVRFQGSTAGVVQAVSFNGNPFVVPGVNLLNNQLNNTTQQLSTPGRSPQDAFAVPPATGVPAGFSLACFGGGPRAAPNAASGPLGTGTLQARIFTHDPGPDFVPGNADDPPIPANCDGTNPDGTDTNLACFQAQPGTTYIGLIDTESETTARLLEIPDVRKCYFGKQNPPYPAGNPRLPVPIARRVLNDQFGGSDSNVNFLQGLCNPADKDDQTHELPQPNNPSTEHLSCYSLSDASIQQPPFTLPNTVQIRTQNFGLDTVRPSRIAELCVQARKTEEGKPAQGQIDGQAYKCYNASGQPRGFQPVTLDDQFFANRSARPAGLSRFCTPVGINAAAPAPVETDDPTTWRHLACYELPSRALFPNQIKVDLVDQLIQAAVGQGIDFTVEFERRFCERARKISVTP